MDPCVPSPGGRRSDPSPSTTLTLLCPALPPPPRGESEAPEQVKRTQELHVTQMEVQHLLLRPVSRKEMSEFL